MVYVRSKKYSTLKVLINFYLINNNIFLQTSYFTYYIKKRSDIQYIKVFALLIKELKSISNRHS